MIKNTNDIQNLISNPNYILRIFNVANKRFLIKNKQIISRNISERTLAASLMYHLNLRLDLSHSLYIADVEFNRNKARKKIIDINNDACNIFTDVIVHSRGECDIDNILCIEMKKATSSEASKEKDKTRLKILTSGTQAIQKYILGIYYEINVEKESVTLEVYRDGLLNNSISFPVSKPRLITLIRSND